MHAHTTHSAYNTQGDITFIKQCSRACMFYSSMHHVILSVAWLTVAIVIFYFVTSKVIARWALPRLSGPWWLHRVFESVQRIPYQPWSLLIAGIRWSLHGDESHRAATVPCWDAGLLTYRRVSAVWPTIVDLWPDVVHIVQHVVAIRDEYKSMRTNTRRSQLFSIDLPLRCRRQSRSIAIDAWARCNPCCTAVHAECCKIVTAGTCQRRCHMVGCSSWVTMLNRHHCRPAY